MEARLHKGTIKLIHVSLYMYIKFTNSHFKLTVHVTTKDVNRPGDNSTLAGLPGTGSQESQLHVLEVHVCLCGVHVCGKYGWWVQKESRKMKKQ